MYRKLMYMYLSAYPARLLLLSRVGARRERERERERERKREKEREGERGVQGVSSTVGAGRAGLTRAPRPADRGRAQLLLGLLRAVLPGPP